MKLIPLDIKKTSDEYQRFYDQSGHGMIPIFAGEKYQTGFGLGSIFGSLLKAALPVVKEGARSLGNTAVKTGLKIASDALSGQSLKDSFSNNIRQAKREVLQRGINYMSKANSHKKRKRSAQNFISNKTSKRKKRRKITPQDTFTN